MNNEPTPNDVAAVAAATGAQPPQQPAQQPPAPQPAPQQQPPTPTPQPSNQTPQTPPAAPTQPTEPSDPFAAILGQEPPQTPPSAPTQPTEPTAPTQPTQPAAPQQPTTPQPGQPSPTPQPSQPTGTTQPTQTTPSQPGGDDYQTFDEYMKEAISSVGQEPTMPDPGSVDPNSPESIKGFFDNLVTTAVAKAEQSVNRKSAIQTKEQQLWGAAFDKYGSLRTNKSLRDMVHNLRMGYFQKGVAITPIQAADKVLEAFGTQYKRGIADNQVTTTIEQVQPNAGSGGNPVPTTLDKNNVLEAVQTGGEDALAAYLDGEVKAGRL